MKFTNSSLCICACWRTVHEMCAEGYYPYFGVLEATYNGNPYLQCKLGGSLVRATYSGANPQGCAGNRCSGNRETTGCNTTYSLYSLQNASSSTLPAPEPPLPLDASECVVASLAACHACMYGCKC